MFCCDQCRVGYHEQSPTSQHKISDKGGQLFGDDIIFLEIILQSFNTFTRHKCPNTLVYNKRKLINKGFIALGTYISLLPFVALFKILSVQGLKLLLCQLQADGFFRFACKWYRGLIMIGQMPRSHF